MRRALTKMRITDFAIENDKAVIAVEIRRGAHKWNKAYGISRNTMRNFDMETFKKQVTEDAKKLIIDQELEDAAMRRIKEFIGPDIILEDITKESLL